MSGRRKLVRAAPCTARMRASRPWAAGLRPAEPNRCALYVMLALWRRIRSACAVLAGTLARRQVGTGMHAAPPRCTQPTSSSQRTAQRAPQPPSAHHPVRGRPRAGRRQGRARFRARLERLDHARHHLVLQAGVLALGVLADGDQVDVVVARLVARQREARPHVCVQLPKPGRVRV